MGRTDGRVCCFRITPLCKLSRHSRFQTGICFNYPDGARSCATLFSLNLPLIEWETRWEARERGGRVDECARGVFCVFRCGWDKSITDKLVNVDPVKKEIWQLFYRVSCWHPTISSWSHSGVFFLECRRFFLFLFRSRIGSNGKKSFQTQNISQTDLSRRKSLQINENMRPSPVGFVALYSTSLGLLYFYRQPERHIPNRNSTLISN